MSKADGYTGVELRQGTWAPWFAWRPVLLDSGEIAWLRTVECKRNVLHLAGMLPISSEEYRECTGLIGTGFGGG